MEQAADSIHRRSAGLTDTGARARCGISADEAMTGVPRRATCRGCAATCSASSSSSVASHMLANLSRREADLLIREQVPDLASLVTRRLGRVAYAVYGSPALTVADARAIRCAACPGSASTRNTTTCRARAGCSSCSKARGRRARQQLAGPARRGTGRRGPRRPALLSRRQRSGAAPHRPDSKAVSAPTNGCSSIATCATWRACAP